MKKELSLALLFCVTFSLSFTSCGSSSEISDDIINGQTSTNPPKEYIVKLGLGGEITSTISPFTRTTTNTDLTGIQVYSCPNDGKSTAYTNYAYGLFDTTSGINIKLLDGYKYKLECTTVMDGKDKLLSDNKAYYTPFYINGVNCACPISNGFTYNTTDNMASISSGNSFLKINNTQNIYYHPNTDRYYGLVTDYVPSENSSISMNMVRAAYGVKIVTDNFKEGSLQVSMKNSPLLTITYPTTEYQDIYSFNYLSNCFTNLNYTEDIEVSANWVKPDGVSVPLDTKTVTFQRNMLTTITIKIQDNSVNNGVNISDNTETLGTGSSVSMGNSSTNTPVNP